MIRLGPAGIAQACSLGGVAASVGLAAALVPTLTDLGDATPIWRLGLACLGGLLAVGLWIWIRARLTPALSRPPADPQRRRAAHDLSFHLARALFLAAALLGASTAGFLWWLRGEPSRALVVGVATYLLFVLPVLGIYLITRSALRPHAAGPPGAPPVRGMRQSVALRLALAVQLPVVVCSVGIVLVEQSNGAEYDRDLEDYYRERYVRVAQRLQTAVPGASEALAELRPPVGVFRETGGWTAIPAALDRIRPWDLRLPPILLLALIALGSAALGRWLASEITQALDSVRRALAELEGGDLEAAGQIAERELGPGLREPAELLRALEGALAGLRHQRDAMLEAAAHRRAADQAKARFLAHLSHELKSPLNSILGFAEVLLGGLDGPLSPRDRDQLTVIWRSGSALLRFILALLDLACLEVPLAGGGARAARPTGLSPAPVSGDQLWDALGEQLHEDPTGEVQVELLDERQGAAGASTLDLTQTVRALHLLTGPFIDTLDRGLICLGLGTRAGRLHLSLRIIAGDAEPAEIERLRRQLARLDHAPTEGAFNATGAILLLVRWVVESQGGALEIQPGAPWPSFEISLPPAS